MDLGIAGWPLRRASADCVELAFRLGRSPIIEIPKDLLDRISVKQLFGIVARSGKTPCLAGTTDFARLSGLQWCDYKRYLDIQASQARFLGCRMLRLFLQAKSRAEFETALGRVVEFASRLRDLEIVLETHHGWETHPDGLDRVLAQNRDQARGRFRQRPRPCGARGTPQGRAQTADRVFPHPQPPHAPGAAVARRVSKRGRRRRFLGTPSCGSPRRSAAGEPSKRSARTSIALAVSAAGRPAIIAAVPPDG